MHFLWYTKYWAVLTFFNTTGHHQSHLNNKIKNGNLVFRDFFESKVKWSKSVDRTFAGLRTRVRSQWLARLWTAQLISFFTWQNKFSIFCFSLNAHTPSNCWTTAAVTCEWSKVISIEPHSWSPCCHSVTYDICRQLGTRWWVVNSDSIQDAPTRASYNWWGAEVVSWSGVAPSNLIYVVTEPGQNLSSCCLW